jgi:hypothetical protein
VISIRIAVREQQQRILPECLITAAGRGTPDKCIWLLGPNNVWFSNLHNRVPGPNLQELILGHPFQHLSANQH